MIVGNLSSFPVYAEMSSALAKIQEFIRNNDLSSLPCNTYEIDGRNVYVNIQEYTTKPFTECRFETHRKYIDVQCILAGQEFIWMDAANQLEESTAYDEQADIQFWKDGKESSLVGLVQDQFVCIFPGEAHKPCVCAGKSGMVKKAVFKIKKGHKK